MEPPSILFNKLFKFLFPYFIMNFQEAQQLLKEYVHKPEILMHCLEVSIIMRFLARELGEDEEKWAIAGLLHDIDYESCLKTEDCFRHPESSEISRFSSLEEHAKKGAEIIKQKYDKIDEEIIHAILAHNEEHTKTKRENKFDFALAASDNISGMIFAYGLMRKSLEGMEIKSLKKKMKEKSFASTVRRDLIYDIDKANIDLDKFLEIAIKAMQSIAREIGFGK